MSKSSIKLTAGQVMQGNNTQKLLGYCNRLNNELGFNITTTNAQGGLLRDSVYAQYLSNVLNEFNFGLQANVVNSNTINRFIERFQEEHPIERDLTYSEDLVDISDYRFSSWIQNTAPFYNELSERVDRRTLASYNNKAFPRRIIRTAITLLNSHNFAANDNIDHRYVRRINLESLQHFVNRVYSHREILPVHPSSPPETSHRTFL